jgi:hypothetical protein
MSGKPRRWRRVSVKDLKVGDLVQLPTYYKSDKRFSVVEREVVKDACGGGQDAFIYSLIPVAGGQAKTTRVYPAPFESDSLLTLR